MMMCKLFRAIVERHSWCQCIPVRSNCIADLILGTYFLVWTCECMEFYECIAKYHDIDYGAFRDREQEESETELKQPQELNVYNKIIRQET